MSGSTQTLRNKVVAGFLLAATTFGVLAKNTHDNQAIVKDLNIPDQSVNVKMDYQAQFEMGMKKFCGKAYTEGTLKNFARAQEVCGYDAKSGLIGLRAQNKAIHDAYDKMMSPAMNYSFDNVEIPGFKAIPASDPYTYFDPTAPLASQSHYPYPEVITANHESNDIKAEVASLRDTTFKAKNKNNTLKLNSDSDLRASSLYDVISTASKMSDPVARAHAINFHINSTFTYNHQKIIDGRVVDSPRANDPTDSLAVARDWVEPVAKTIQRGSGICSDFTHLKAMSLIAAGENPKNLAELSLIKRDEQGKTAHHSVLGVKTDKGFLILDHALSDKSRTYFPHRATQTVNNISHHLYPDTIQQVFDPYRDGANKDPWSLAQVHNFGTGKNTYYELDLSGSAIPGPNNWKDYRTNPIDQNLLANSIKTTYATHDEQVRRGLGLASLDQAPPKSQTAQTLRSGPTNNL